MLKLADALGQAAEIYGHGARTPDDTRPAAIVISECKMDCWTGYQYARRRNNGRHFPFSFPLLRLLIYWYAAAMQNGRYAILTNGRLSKSLQVYIRKTAIDGIAAEILKEKGSPFEISILRKKLEGDAEEGR